MLFNDTITLYNQYPNGYDVSYKSTVFENAELQLKSGENLNNPDDLAVLHINKLNLPKDYLSPKEWLASTDKDNYFTLSTNDFFISGNVVITNPNFNTIKNSYDNVFKIDKIADYDLIPHFEVRGK